MDAPSRQLIVAPWDVVRIDFPYADDVTTRRRPALVVATPRVHERFTILWVLMITSARRQVWPGEMPVSDLPLPVCPMPVPSGP